MDSSDSSSRKDSLIIGDCEDYDNEIFLDICSALQESDVKSESTIEFNFNEKRRKWPSLYPNSDRPARRLIKRVKQACTVQLTDDRRFFGKQKVDMINCADLDSLRAWMERVYEPDVVYTERYVQYVPIHPVYVETRGIDQMLDFHAANLASMPDMTGSCLGSKLTLREDGSSYLVVKVIVQGIFVQRYTLTNATPTATRFLKKWNLDSIFSTTVTSHGKTLVQSWKLSPEDEAKIIQEQVKIATPSTQIVFEPTMQTEPVQFLVEITVVMYINKQHKVYREEILKRVLPSTLTIDPYDASQDAKLFGSDVEEEFIV